MKKPRPRKSARRHLSAGLPRRTTISLCVIARDEERFIGDCLASARSFVDEIVVVDTGSSDATVEIARRYGARIGSFAWRDDFAAARNAAIDLASSDWIFMLDADERLQAQSGPLLRAFIESNPTGPLFYAPRIENRESDNPADDRVSFANRIFQRLPGLRYVGAVHEDLSYPPDPARATGWRLDYIRVTHLGYLAEVVESRGKFERNRQILLSETLARPDDPLPLYYLGVQHLVARQPAEAASYLRRSLACSGTRPTWSKVDVYTQLVVAYAQLNQDDSLQLIVEEAERGGLLSANARLVLAQRLIEHDLYPAAEEQLLRALEPNQPLETVTQTGVGGWVTRLDLARLYEHVGNPTAALQQLELVLADPALRDRGDVAAKGVQLAVQLGDMSSLARCLENVTEPGEADLEGHLRLLELRSMAGPPTNPHRVFDQADRAIGSGDWQSAYDAALRLSSGRTAAEAARVLFVAARLQQGGAPAAALNLLGRLHDAQPSLPAVHALLVTVLKDLGRYDDALAANEILQMLLAERHRPVAA
jgi:tetratricopeptide (TPR) repeat protein